MIRSILCMCLCFMAVSLNGAEKTMTECSKQLMQNFFPEEFVINTLKKFEIPEKDFDSIVKELSQKDAQVFVILANKASKITPNPLTNPKERQAGLKLFLDTLQEIFSTTLKNHGITDDQKIQSMFNDIRQQSSKSFGQCLKAKS